MSIVVSKEGAVIIGGNSSKGKELMIGFSVSGRVLKKEVIRKRGEIQDGDLLVLTKRIGKAKQRKKERKNLF